MKYKIMRTDKAEEQLREIIFYIADNSGSVDTVITYLDKIETAINRYTKIFNFKKAGISSTHCGKTSCLL